MKWFRARNTGALVMAALALLGGDSIARAGLEPEVSDDLLGQAVPEFQATTLDGKSFALAELRGKVAIVHVFASWCPPCQKVNRSIREIHPDFKGKGVTFVGVLADAMVSPDTVDEARRELKKAPLPYPVVLLNESIKNAFRFKGFPATYFITEDGKFSKTMYGPHPTDAFRATANQVLRQNAGPRATPALLQPTLQAVKTDSPPKLDGVLDDAAWAKATELKLEAECRGGAAQGNKTSVGLKAAYDQENVYFMLRWQDTSEDKTHKSYVWNEETKTYEVGKDLEDNAALSFPIRGKFTADMLSGEDELWDVWHWKALRTGPAGYAMDRTHVFSTGKPEGKAAEHTAKKGNKIWIARPEDKGSSVTKENPTPKDKQATTPAHYEAVKPTGSAADIRTGQSYKDGWWTIEFARKLNTGNADDAQFTTGGTCMMGVAVFDKSEHENHFTHGPIRLRLE